jgi:hypothetical protein
METTWPSPTAPKNLLVEPPWPPPPSLPTTIPQEPIDRRRAGRALLSCLAAGIVTDVATNAGAATLVGAVSVVVIAIVIWWHAPRRNRSGVACLAAAVVCAAWLPFRASDWLVPLNAGSAAAAVLFGAALLSGGRLAESMHSHLRRLAKSLEHVLITLHWIGRATKAVVPRRLIRRLRIAAIILPALIAVTALLASADAFFASFIHLNIPSGTESNTSWTIVLTFVVLAGHRMTTAAPTAAATTTKPARGGVELTWLLGGLATLYTVFAVTQLAAAVAGAPTLSDAPA